jgi:hypothetical protein
MKRLIREPELPATQSSGQSTHKTKAVKIADNRLVKRTRHVISLRKSVHTVDQK